MVRLLWLTLALAVFATATPAGEAQRRLLPREDAVAYRAVGRLNVAGSRFCSATLVSSRLVITAAHCLFHPGTRKPVPLSELKFVAGLYRGDYSALRNIRRAATLPGFVYDKAASIDGVGSDLGIIELSDPISADDVVPFELSLPPRGQTPLTIVSYARDRSQAPSIQELCAFPEEHAGVVAVDCAVDFGASGAPVLADFGPDKRVIAVVSAMGESAAGANITLAVVVAPRLAELRVALDGPAWPGER